MKRLFMEVSIWQLTFSIILNVSLSISSDFYGPNQHSNMNPFAQAPAFVNSGPDSFIDFNQYESDYYVQQPAYLEQAPKTPIRTPVMGTRTYHHRRTLSNASSQYSSRGVQIDYGEVMNPPELDYRFNNFKSKRWLQEYERGYK